MTKLSPERANRCHAHTRVGDQCNNTSMVGLEVCRKHGGKSPAAQRKSALVKAELQIQGMRKFTTPIDPDDWEANPLNSFEMEFRRTIAHIRYYEEKIAALAEEELIWGKTKEEDKNATEFGGVDTTFEAQPHLYEVQLFKERRHLVELQKIWISAKLDTKKMELQRDIMDRLETVLTNVIVGLGRDPRDPEVRQAVRVAMTPIAS